MFRKLTFAALSVIMLASCTVSPTTSVQAGSLTGKAAYEAAPQFTEAELQQLVDGYNQFAAALFAHQSESQENLVISPYSLYRVLGMLYAGAAGQTAAEMAETMHLPADDASVQRLMNALNQQLLASAGSGEDLSFELEMANALWAAQDRQYEQAFLDALSQNYNIGLNTLDFTNASAAAEAINAWVEEQTNQKITDLADPAMFSADTALALTNAVYFKAAWLYPFNENATADAAFSLLSGEQTNVPTMHLSETISASVTDDLTVVQLPYAGGTMVMEILMPSLDAWSDTSALAELLSSETMLSELEPTSVSLSMPKFKIETATMDLIPALQSSGMQLAFTDQADFSGISGDQSLYVSTIAQKAFIDVNEQGTEAAAATIAVVVPKMAPGGDPLQIRIDRPFIYQIRDTSSGTVLFMGTVMQP